VFDRVNQKLLARMKDAGLRVVSYGVESGNEQVIDLMKKEVSLEQIKTAYKMTNDLGIQATAYFMVGNVGETQETADQTLDFALSLPATFASMSPTTAYPGTELHQTAIDKKYLSDPAWYLQDIEKEIQFGSVPGGVSPGQLQLPDFSPTKQIAFAKKFWWRFYFRPVIAYRIFGQHFSLRLLLRAIKFMPTFLRFIFSKSGPKIRYAITGRK
jgi:radical SAM superfamily enzyme YgiQ (UPF0313 family)